MKDPLDENGDFERAPFDREHLVEVLIALFLFALFFLILFFGMEILFEAHP